MSKRLQAYGKLTHHALNELFVDDEGCCPECCAPCHALKDLDDEGVLDSVVRLWAEYDDGTPTLTNHSWWKEDKVDREWMYGQWHTGQMNCSHDHVRDQTST